MPAALPLHSQDADEVSPGRGQQPRFRYPDVIILLSLRANAAQGSGTAFYLLGVRDSGFAEAGHTVPAKKRQHEPLGPRAFQPESTLKRLVF